MKTQYVIGTPTKEFIRLYDRYYAIGCSLTSAEAEDAKKVINKNVKIYKLVEVKK